MDAVPSPNVKLEIETDSESHYDDDSFHLSALKSSFMENVPKTLLEQRLQRCLADDGDGIDVNCNKCQNTFLSFKTFLDHLERKIDLDPHDADPPDPSTSFPSVSTNHNDTEDIILADLCDTLSSNCSDNLFEAASSPVSFSMVNSQDQDSVEDQSFSHDIVTRSKHLKSSSSTHHSIVPDLQSFACSIPSCERTFKYESVYKHHVRTCHHLPSSKKQKKKHFPGVFTCPKADCGKKFRYKPGLSYHILSKHKSTEGQAAEIVAKGEDSSIVVSASPSSSPPLPIKKKKSKKQLPGIFICPYENCGKKFKYRPGLSYHVSRHKQAAEQADKNENFGEIKDSKSKQSQKERKVNKNLSRNKKSLKCKFCDQQFKTRDSVRRHEKLHENPNKVFVCHVCHQQCSNANILAFHIDRKHGAQEKRRYKCTEPGCDKSFFSSTDLKNHFRVHSKERPYICPICHRSFNDPSNFRKHVQGVHGNDRKYLCSECGAAFTQSNSLRRHLKIHAGTTNRRYLCTICGKLFQDNHALMRHQSVHTGEKNFQCPAPNCTAAYTQPPALRKHIQVHHPDLVQESSSNSSDARIEQEQESTADEKFIMFP